MRLQTRIGLLLVLMATLVFAGLLAMSHHQDRDLARLVAEREARAAEWLNRRLGFEARSLQDLAEHLGRNPALASLLGHPGPAQSPVAVDDMLSRSPASIAWVLRPDFSLRYTAGSYSGAGGRPPLPPEALARSFSTHRFPHYFALDGERLLEVAAAPVSMDQGPAQPEPPLGYVLVARRWDPALLQDWEQSTGTRLQLQTAGRAVSPEQDGLPARPLYGWDGETVAWLLTRTGGLTPEGGRPGALPDTVWMLGFSAGLAALAFVLLRRWISRPLRLLTESLRQQDPALRRELQASGEFHQISDFIDELHGQRSDLANRVSEQQRLERQLLHIASHDPGTGLANRSLFTERLTHAVSLAGRQRHRLALLLIDLDRFKHVNDSLGHAAGDRLLRLMAERIRHTVPDADLVARLGGDEFVVCIEELGEPRNAAALAAELLETLARPARLEEQELVVTGSLGISVYPEDGTDADTLVKHAANAMYRAKEEGRGRYTFFDPALRERSASRLSLESALRRALEREELSLLYQPRVNLASGRINAVEALIRWQHPQLGLISPEQFISLAEEIGLINPISHWMMRTACAQNVAWQQAGLPQVRVAVNVSPEQFRQEEVFSEVLSVLDETGLAPQWLELELTETLLVRSFETASRHVTRLRELGVSFAIDDFGVGYSALSYLRRLPVDIIKIDRSFVQDLPGDANDAALVDAIIGMAHGLRLRVVAEGVETAEQVELLRRQGCDDIQGFHISRPLPAPQLAALLDVERQVRHIRPVGDAG